MDQIYSIIWKIFSKTTNKVLMKPIYPRNSFHEKTYKVFFSDIDYSVFLDHSHEAKKTVSWNRIARTLCPIIGECNIYTNESLQLIRHFFSHSMEIRRDPELSKRITIPSESTPYEALSFLLFCGINDIQKLKLKKHPHQQKWLRHFSKATDVLPFSLDLKKFDGVVNLKNFIKWIHQLSATLTKPENPSVFSFKLQTALELGFHSLQSSHRKDLFLNHPQLQQDLISSFPEFFAESVSADVYLTPFQSALFIENMRLSGLSLLRSPVFYRNPSLSQLRLQLFIDLLNKVQVSEDLDNKIEDLKTGFLKSRDLLRKNHPDSVHQKKTNWIIKTNSMEPLIYPGDSLQIRPFEEGSVLKRFDVILFKRGVSLFCHFVWKNQDQYNQTFVTRSLRSPLTDEDPVKKLEIIGIVDNFQISKVRRLYIRLLHFFRLQRT